MCRKWGKYGVGLLKETFLLLQLITLIFLVKWKNEVDQESRKSELGTKWKLNESIFGSVKKYQDFHRVKSVQIRSFSGPYLNTFHTVFYPSFDLFTFRCSTPSIFCLSMRPKSWRENLQKIILDNAADTLIVPNWPRQFWFTVSQGLLFAGTYMQII